jgi:small subunit ribosomal protein S20
MTMANMKQQIKRYKNADKKRAINNSYKSALKTAIKNVRAEVEAGNKEAAVAAYNVAASKLDASVSKGFHHKNYASRQKSKLQKKINALG